MLQKWIGALATLGVLGIATLSQAQLGPFSAPTAGGSANTGGATIVQKSVAAPAGTASVTLVMAGLAVPFQPTYSGQTFILIQFNHTSSVATDGGKVQCAFGTGAAPANGAAFSGTTFGSLKTFTSGTTTPTVEHGSCGGMVTLNPTAGTTYWIDVQFEAVTGGTYTLSNVDITAFEVG
jgi:hypothetical protein